jgi:hypothetical protein
MKLLRIMGLVCAIVSVSACTTVDTVDTGPLAGSKMVLCSYALPISQCQERAVQECPSGYQAVKYGGSINGKKMWLRCTDTGKFENDETKVN